MPNRTPHQHQALTTVEVRKFLLLRIHWLNFQAWLEPSERGIPFWPLITAEVAEHLEYLDAQGWIPWPGGGPPIPTLRGLYLAEALEECQTLEQFLFSRDE